MSYTVPHNEVSQSKARPPVPSDFFGKNNTPALRAEWAEADKSLKDALVDVLASHGFTVRWDARYAGQHALQLVNSDGRVVITNPIDKTIPLGATLARMLAEVLEYYVNR
jgi:hypothetical protein